jgi:hypothetical protein
MRRTATSVSSVWAAPLSARVLKVSSAKMSLCVQQEEFRNMLVKIGEKNQCVTLIKQKDSCYDFSIDAGTVIVFPLKIKILK